MKKLMNFRPLLFLAIGIALSIYASNLFLLEKTFLGVAILSGLLIFSALFCFIVNNKKLLIRNAIFFVIFLIVCSAGFLSFRITTNGYEKATLNDAYYTVYGRVEEVIDEDNYTRLIIKDVKVEGHKNGDVKYKISASVTGEIDVDIGDEIKFYALISDYSAYYEERISATNIINKVKYSTFITADDITIGENKANLFEKVNTFIRDTLKEGLTEDEFGVAYAMLCGNSDYIEVGLLEDYRSAGVAHIFAVSGLHIGFLCAVLTFILKKVPINEYLKAVIIVLVLLFYSGVCGFSASSLRATVMCGVHLLANSGGKRYDMLSSIGLAAILILIVIPHELLCAGFMLSFGVVLGIILLSPPIKRLLKFMPEKLSSALAVVISAQLFSMPISLSLFGQVSLIAVLANLVFIPFVSVIYVFSFVCTLLGGVFNAQKFFLFGPKYILKGVNYVVSIIDYDVFIIGGFSLGAFIIAYYLTTFILSDVINLKISVKSITSAILVSVFVLGVMIYNIDDSKKSTAYVIGANGISATAVLSKEEDVLIISNADGAFSLSRLKSFANKTDVKRFDKLIIGNMDTKLDAQVICSRINSVFSFDTVYYCGEEDGSLKSVLESSFHNTKFICCGIDGESNKGDNFKFIANGYGVNIFIDEKSVVVFNEFGKDLACFVDDRVSNPDLLIVYDYEDRIEANYKPTLTVSYRKSKTYLDGETHGNFKYNFA